MVGSVIVRPRYARGICLGRRLSVIANVAKQPMDCHGLRPRNDS